MTFHWPQITWCVLATLGLLSHAALNGQTHEKEYNFPLQLIAAGIAAWVLYMGGFFGS